VFDFKLQFRHPPATPRAVPEGNWVLQLVTGTWLDIAINRIAELYRNWRYTLLRAISLYLLIIDETGTKSRIVQGTFI